jgi:transposase
MLVTHKPMSLVFEACAGAHYWARFANDHDHSSMILPAQFVAGSRQGQKTDGNDAIACAVAGHHPNARPVAVKTETQQAMQAVERTQQALTKQSTALNNMLISFLFEFGIKISKR